MKAKEYIGTDLMSIVKQAQQEFGTDVYVVKEETIKKRVGLFKKRRQKVLVASLEKEDIKHIEDCAIERYETSHLAQIKDEMQKAIDERDLLKEEHRKVKEENLKIKEASKKDDATNKMLNEHMKELRNTIRGMSLKMDSFDTKKLYPMAVQDLERSLKHQDTDSDTISSILRHVTMNLTIEEQNTPELVISSAKQYIRGMCTNIRSITENANKKKIVMFVGTTGVGKTTTIAKLATTLRISNKNSSTASPVGVITIDTYREGAVEQIRNLCKYTDIPVQVANSKETLLNALEKFNDKKYIFIDTTGRSQHNVAEIRKIQDVVGDILGNIDEIYLVMSATTKTQDMKDIYSNFKWMNINRAMFTKLDETNKYGNILSFVDAHPHVALSYITTGQVVPTDIELISPAKFSDHILQTSEQNTRI